jgi:hypothetical protein
VQQASAFPIAVDGHEEQLAKTGAYIAGQISDNGIPAEQVARTIADAAQATEPKSSYVLPVKARLWSDSWECCPTGSPRRRPVPAAISLRPVHDPGQVR